MLPQYGIGLTDLEMDAVVTLVLSHAAGAARATADAKGAQETVNENDLFYWPPGHNVKVDADAEIIMFSPQREHSHVINHMIAKVKA